MLTADLIRSRTVGDNISPRYITRRYSANYLDDCLKLIGTFEKHIGKTQEELMSALENLEGKRTDFKIFRGLAKLLSEDGEFSPARQINYPALRHSIFSRAQNHYPIVSKSDLLHQNQRDQILSEAAQEFEVPVKVIDGLLYGDLPENQILTSFKTTHTPETLLKRYNLAQAQGLLYRAIRLRILLKEDYRIVFQYIKLSGLMHWITPLPSNGMEIILDGPSSLFRNTQRYGIRMANFLPGLLLAKTWEMRADIQTPQGPKFFYLDPKCGLTSHYSPGKRFDSQIEEKFFIKFTRKEREWTIEREGEVIDLGDSVFIPDFTFRHPDGRSASLEIVGFWTPEYLNKKIGKIKRSKRKNLVLAVNKQLNCSRDDFQGEIMFYRTGLKIGECLEKLEKVAC